MLCIFCLEDKPPGRPEHLFTRSIGGTLTIDRVCGPCNHDHLAKVDALLVDHPAVVAQRSALGIRGRNGVPDAIGRLFKSGTLVADPSQVVDMRSDPEIGMLRPKLRYNKRRIQLDDGREMVQVVIDAQEQDQIGKIIQGVRRLNNLPLLDETSLRAEVDRIISDKRETKHPEILFNPTIDMRQYQRGVLKIVYELAWRWLGDDYLTDPIAAELREVIRNGFSEPALGYQGRIEFGAGNMFALYPDEPNTHFALAQTTGNGISIAVRVFSAVSGVVLVTNDAARYTAFRGEEGMFLSIDPQHNSPFRETTLSAEITRLCDLQERAEV